MQGKTKSTQQILQRDHEDGCGLQYILIVMQRWHDMDSIFVPYNQ